jgi:hypothetical protein
MAPPASGVDFQYLLFFISILLKFGPVLFLASSSSFAPAPLPVLHPVSGFPLLPLQGYSLERPHAAVVAHLLFLLSLHYGFPYLPLPTSLSCPCLLESHTL